MSDQETKTETKESSSVQRLVGGQCRLCNDDRKICVIHDCCVWCCPISCSNHDWGWADVSSALLDRHIASQISRSVAR